MNYFRNFAILQTRRGEKDTFVNYRVNTYNDKLYIKEKMRVRKLEILKRNVLCLLFEPNNRHPDQ